MKVRLVKPDVSPPKAIIDEPPSAEVQITATIQTWLREFKSGKARQASRDSRQVNHSE